MILFTEFATFAFVELATEALLHEMVETVAEGRNFAIFDTPFLGISLLRVGFPPLQVPVFAVFLQGENAHDHPILPVMRHDSSGVDTNHIYIVKGGVPIVLTHPLL